MRQNWPRLLAEDIGVPEAEIGARDGVAHEFAASAEAREQPGAIGGSRRKSILQPMPVVEPNPGAPAHRERHGRFTRVNSQM